MLSLCTGKGKYIGKYRKNIGKYINTGKYSKNIGKYSDTVQLWVVDQ